MTDLKKINNIKNNAINIETNINNYREQIKNATDDTSRNNLLIQYVEYINLVIKDLTKLQPCSSKMFSALNNKEKECEKHKANYYEKLSELLTKSNLLNGIEEKYHNFYTGFFAGKVNTEKRHSLTFNLTDLDTFWRKGNYLKNKSKEHKRKAGLSNGGKKPVKKPTTKKPVKKTTTKKPTTKKPVKKTTTKKPTTKKPVKKTTTKKPTTKKPVKKTTTKKPTTKKKVVKKKTTKK